MLILLLSYFILVHIPSHGEAARCLYNRLFFSKDRSNTRVVTVILTVAVIPAYTMSKLR